jgi:hypothetical protein
MNLAA